MKSQGGLDVALILGLYRRYLSELRRVRDDQRRLYAQRGDTAFERYAMYRALRIALLAVHIPPHYKRRLKPKLDDLEAEITYLLIREFRPITVVEIAPDRGWSSTWILRALRDNGAGALYSYDLYDHATRTIPAELATGRWTFIRGDVTRNLERLPGSIDYLFLDAAHTAEFARWYIEHLFPRLGSGTLVGVHDVFHRSDPGRFPEGPVLVEWLERREGGTSYFTASPAKAPQVYKQLMALKQELGIDAPIHWSRVNPMTFFRV